MTDTIKSLSALLADGKTSSVELCQDTLGRIERLNPTLNAFITLDPDRTLAEAAAADADRKSVV